MKCLWLITLIALAVIEPVIGFGQEAERSCVDPEIVQLPLVDDDLKERIYYQSSDKYTYWYQMELKKENITYSFRPMNEADDYEVLVYSFKGENFCNEVVNKNVQPISNKKSGIIQVNPGEKIFIGVLHINGAGCGHELKITEGKNNLVYQAIQNECVEEVMEEIIVEKVEEEIEVELVDTSNNIQETTAASSGIKGRVVNGSTKEIIEATLAVMKLSGEPIIQLNSEIDRGFILEELQEEKILIGITKLGYKNLLDTVNLSAQEIVLELDPIKVGEKIIMHKIYFHPNTYVLREESKTELKKLNKFMLENKKYSFEIQGHTNGNRNVKRNKRYAHLGEEWNFKGTSKKLSKLRAEKIKAYMVKNGVAETQIKTVGYGGDQMIVQNPKTMKQAMKNIRVEVIITQ
jgi:outer membrane protein OmpA-like peptidoglycan-associated protein